MQKKLPPLFRLTLTAKAFALAKAHSKPLSGVAVVPRKDGKVDVAITLATANTLFQMAEPKENLSDTVIRLLSKKEGV